ncbi:stalk domain-containing protein [Paenibacillus sp. FSL W7-1287]|uniref:stalk domain-containing protein n=1 Tax=Paenibacillus sp. FSL W7-1287 TaxID=2954538 RepID=UPI0030FA4802
MKANKLGIRAILLAIACVLMVSIGTTPVNAVTKQKNVVVYKANFHFVVNGQVYHAPKDTQGFLYNNRTYVPIRFASYLLEKSVEWNQMTSTVSVKQPSESQLKQLQNYKKQYLVPNVDVKKPASSLKKETIYTLVDAAGYNFFGKEQSIPKDVTTFLHKGTLYVPLRYFAELIQHDISYSSATHTITMNTRSQNGDGDNGTGNGNTGGTVTDPGTGDIENPGSGAGEVVPPTREELVSAVDSQLRRMEQRVTTIGYTMYEKYSNATTPEEIQSIKDEFYALIAKTDGEVQAILSQLDKDLTTYNYEVGSDSADFRAAYEAKKEVALALVFS